MQNQELHWQSLDWREKEEDQLLESYRLSTVLLLWRWKPGGKCCDELAQDWNGHQLPKRSRQKVQHSLHRPPKLRNWDQQRNHALGVSWQDYWSRRSVHVLRWLLRSNLWGGYNVDWRSLWFLSVRSCWVQSQQDSLGWRVHFKGRSQSVHRLGQRLHCLLFDRLRLDNQVLRKSWKRELQQRFLPNFRIHSCIWELATNHE